MPQSNLFLMSGDDLFSMKEEVARWHSAFTEKYGNSDLEELDGEIVTQEALSNAISALPFFSEHRLILLKNFLSTRKADDCNELIPLLDHLPDSSFLLIIESHPDKRTSAFKAVGTRATQRLFIPPKGPQLATWVLRRAEKLGAQISLPVANILIAWVGEDPFVLSNEIQKLSLYAQGQPITQQMVEELSANQVEQSIFTFTDQLAARNRTGALQTLHALQEQGEEASYLFAMLVRQIRLLLEMKALSDEGKSPALIAKIMAVHPFVVSNTLRHTKQFTYTELRKLLSEFLTLDRRLKTGFIQLRPREEDHFLLMMEKSML